MELQFENREGKLLPGVYAQVTFEPPPPDGRIRVPGSAILYTGDEPALVALGPDGGVSLKTIRLGRDDGRMVEIALGVSPQNRIVDTPRTRSATGTSSPRRRTSRGWAETQRPSRTGS